MRVIYFGSDVQAACFEYMLETGVGITALYTYHEDAEYIGEGRITELARSRGIPVHYDRMTLERAETLFDSGECDLFFSAEYDAYIPIPKSARFRGVNIHNSLLPEGRGYFPIEMRLYYDYTYGGVTLHKLAKRLDRGDTVLQRRFDISPEDDDRILYRRCAELALDITKEYFADPEGCWQRAVPQKGAGSYWNKPTPAQTTITPFMHIARIRHIYRAMGRFTTLELNGESIKVESLSCERGDSAGQVGELICRSDGALRFRAKDGVVSVMEQSKAE